MKLRMLPLMLAAALSLPALATETGDAAKAAREELARAREELAEAARRVAELQRQLMEEGQFEGYFRALQRPGVGVVLAENEGKEGVRLAAVTPGGPADKAGLRGGDVLVSVDGRKVEGSGEAAVASARRLLSGLEKGQKLRLGYRRDGKAGTAEVTVDDIGRLALLRGDEARAHADALVRAMPVIAPTVDMEIARLAAAPCASEDEDCRMPQLLEAFRWNGLNLATVDDKLGRYFGADRGVLVLSSGELPELEPGDVIRKIDDEPVESPRQAMRALRQGKSGDRVTVEVLRDRKPHRVEVTVPETPDFRWFAPPPPAPPAPPTPPKPPKPPRAAAAPLPPAPPAPPAPPGLPEADEVVFADGVIGRIVARSRHVDDNGNVTETQTIELLTSE